MLNNRLEQKITVIAKRGANVYNESHYYKLRKAIVASRVDKQVCCMVDYFNDHLRLINRNCGTPRISRHYCVKQGSQG